MNPGQILWEAICLISRPIFFCLFKSCLILKFYDFFFCLSLLTWDPMGALKFQKATSSTVSV